MKTKKLDISLVKLTINLNWNLKGKEIHSNFDIPPKSEKNDNDEFVVYDFKKLNC